MDARAWCKFAFYPITDLASQYQTYENRGGIANFTLASRHGILDKSVTLKDIMDQGSELVVFRAVQPGASTPPEATTSTSLRKPRSASNMTTASPRHEPQHEAGFAASPTSPDHMQGPPQEPHAVS
jgi:hypothetical protein